MKLGYEISRLKIHVFDFGNGVLVVHMITEVEKDLDMIIFINFRLVSSV